MTDIAKVAGIDIASVATVAGLAATKIMGLSWPAAESQFIWNQIFLQIDSETITSNAAGQSVPSEPIISVSTSIIAPAQVGISLSVPSVPTIANGETVT